MWPRGDPQIERIRIALAQLRYYQDDAVGAASLLEESLRQLEQRFPPHHPLLIQPRLTLGHCQRQIGDRPAARRTFEELLPVALEGLPADSPLLQELRAALATTLSADGEWTPARALFEEMVDVYRELGQLDQYHALRRQLTYARQLRHHGEHDAADAILERLQQGTSNSPDETWLRVNAGAYRALILLDQGRIDEAAEALRHAMARLDETPGPESFRLQLEMTRAAIEDAQSNPHALDRTRDAWEQYRNEWTHSIDDRWQLERILSSADRMRGSFLTRFRNDPAAQLEVVEFHRTVSSRLHRDRFEIDGAHQPHHGGLRPDELAISITRATPDHVGPAGDRRPRYLAWIVPPDGTVQSVELGIAREIDASVGPWVAALTRPGAEGCVIGSGPNPTVDPRRAA